VSAFLLKEMQIESIFDSCFFWFNSDTDAYNQFIILNLLTTCNKYI